MPRAVRGHHHTGVSDDIGGVAHVGRHAIDAASHGLGHDVGKSFGAARQHVQVQAIHHGGHLIAGAGQHQAFPQAELVDQRHQLRIVGRHAAPHQHAAQPRVASIAHQRGHGAQQIAVVLQGIPARHAADHRHIAVQAPLGAHARARGRVGRIARQVVAVRDHHHAVAAIALCGMALRRVLRRAHDRAGQHARQQRAGAQHHAGGAAAALEVGAGIANAPGDGAHARQAGRQAADQVGVVHPGLHRARPGAGDQATQAHEAPQRDAAARHAERMHGDAGGPQPLAIEAVVGQRHHDVLDVLSGEGGQPPQHGFGAALAQAGDHVHDAQCGGAHRPSLTASNNWSHSASTLASA